ncbi:hypothetical protein Sste5346_007890 [Sporothrix stenoceras]|uniref:LysM domain-containing protein n=1 Tax=Sporothrix stenoceras TaxID=5173 RepID=A0ABR3YSR7_9PEZI
MGRLASFVAAGLLVLAPALVSAAAVAAPAADITAAPFVGHEIIARTVNCEFQITADDNATCVEFASEWGLTLAQFEALNPTAACPTLTPDTLYCVLGSVTGASSSGSVGPNRSPTTVSYTLPTGTGGPSSVDISFSTYPTTTSTTSKTSTKTSTTSSSTITGSKPAPTQAGLTASCNNFHLVAKGDSCSTIEASYGVSSADFLSWNPAIQSNCLGLLTGYYVCVGVPGATTSTVKPTSTSTTTTSKATTTITTSKTSTTTSKASTSTSKTSTTSAVPSPLQPGTFDNCTSYHLVAAGDSCSAIETAAGISSAQFAAWNSGVDADCTNIDVGYYLCVGGGGGVVSTIPSPLQPGTFSNCTAYHLIAAGDSCSAIESAAGISSAEFAAWNSGVNAGCTNIDVGYYLCVGGGGGVVSTIPSPLQPGTEADCTKYHLVVAGDSCGAIESAAGISAAQFAAWNTGVDSSCSNIQVGYYLCIAGGTNAVSTTPSPLQPGTISTCTKYHLVASGDTCGSIESAAGITAAQWAAWNPDVNSACSNIELGYYVCIGA